MQKQLPPPASLPQQLLESVTLQLRAAKAERAAEIDAAQWAAVEAAAAAEAAERAAAEMAAAQKVAAEKVAAEKAAKKAAAEKAAAEKAAAEIAAAKKAAAERAAAEIAAAEKAAAVRPPAMMKRQSTDAWSNEPPVPVTKSAPSAESGPCSQYRVDLTGAVFGQCKCGFAKAEHAPSAFGRGK